jgi:purine-binding chemotaxis protein CheW
MDITPVHQAPDYVRGVINLRGQIVTVIDVRKKFNMPSRAPDKQSRILVVRSKNEDIGLLLDSVDDILPANPSQIEPAPAHLHEGMGQYFSSVFKLKNDLVAILDIDNILEMAEE